MQMCVLEILYDSIEILFRMMVWSLNTWLAINWGYAASGLSSLKFLSNETISDVDEGH